MDRRANTKNGKKIQCYWRAVFMFHILYAWVQAAELIHSIKLTECNMLSLN